jgi:hypothetical protein
MPLADDVNKRRWRTMFKNGVADAVAKVGDLGIGRSQNGVVETDQERRPSASPTIPALMRPSFNLYQSTVLTLSAMPAHPTSAYLRPTEARSLLRVKLRSLASRGTCRFDPQQQTSSRYMLRSLGATSDIRSK